MAEIIAFSVVANLITKLGTVAFSKISSACGVEDQLRKLKDTLSTIQAALLDADRRKEKSDLMQNWIRKLNDVVYDADDLLDAVSTKALRRELNTTTHGRIHMKKVREFFSSSNQLAFRYKLDRSIKEIRERFDEIAANMSKFNFVERLTVQASVENNNRETISFVSTSDIIGREKDKEEVLKLLMSTRSNEENVTVITIVGMGGLGKTALTQLVFNDEKVVQYFGLRLWVCVSEDFEKKSLVKKILKSLTNNEVGDLELEQLQIRLRENLDGKRFLLVLDDIWNEKPQKWELVKKLLMGGAKGSKIVVTTRSRQVASLMGIEAPYILKGLSHQQSWTLFEKVAFCGHETVHSNLVVTGKEIVEKCKGVPLAIQSLASAMQSKTQESEWLSIRNSDVWSLCQDDVDILPILKLSYDHLPIHLRQCFAFCSIFPKDHEIEKELLIQLWMAQGYIQSSNNSQCLEDIGDQYFRNLLSRSFFQDSKVNDYNEVISCKMHDLVHDLATRVAGSDCAIAETYEDNISNRVHHVSIVFRSEELPRQMLKAKGLRTFLATSDHHYFYWRQTSICRMLMSPSFTCLRVLDVHGRRVPKVLSSIGKLQHLRYLDLSRNDITSLPNTIRKLVNLQTLKLSGCYKLERLPQGITKLINLRYLVNVGCPSLVNMPSGMRKLTSLQRLNKFVVGGNKWGIRLRELNELNMVRGHISIEGLENVKDGKSEGTKANLMAKQYLHSLTLKWGGNPLVDGDMDEILLEGLQPHPKLRELSIRGYRGQMFPSWTRTGNIVISLPNIVRIILDGCNRCEHLTLLSLDQLPFLKFLKIYRLDRVEYINNHRVEERKSSSTSTEEEEEEGMSVFFPSLEELVIEFLPRLKGWWRAAAAAEEEERASESSLRPSLFPRLTTLEISHCPKLTSMPIQLSHVEKLGLYKVPEKLVRQLLLLTTSSATTTEAITAAASSSSSSSTSYSSIPTAIISSKLKHLVISCIEDLESPLPMVVFRNLASLETLQIQSCTRLSSCFALGSEKEEEEEEEGFFRALLPSLRSLHILDCRSLTSFVVSGPGGITLQHLLPALQHLNIDACPNFDFSGDHGVYWKGMRNILSLKIEDIRKLVSLPLGIQQLTTLQRLTIYNCPGLMALPDWLSNLTSLQILIIKKCPMLSERCQKETGEDWLNISHIPTIEIDL